MRGYVYLAGNMAMPHLYKIGFTADDALVRMKQLSAASSVPLRFDLLCYTEHGDARRLEQHLHRFFYDSRVSGSREFFRFDGSVWHNHVHVLMMQMLRLDAHDYVVCDVAADYGVDVSAVREAVRKTLELAKGLGDA